MKNNNISTILNSSEKYKIESSEIINNKKHCTFKPNLNATKRMNMLLSTKTSPDSNILNRKASPTAAIGSSGAKEDLHNSTQMSINSNNSKVTLNQSVISKPVSKQSKMDCYVNNTRVFHVNLVSSSNSVSSLNWLVRDGYSARSLERKSYIKYPANTPQFRVANFKRNRDLLSKSRSEISLARSSASSNKAKQLMTERHKVSNKYFHTVRDSSAEHINNYKHRSSSRPEMQLVTGSKNLTKLADNDGEVLIKEPDYYSLDKQ